MHSVCKFASKPLTSRFTSSSARDPSPGVSPPPPKPRLGVKLPKPGVLPAQFLTVILVSYDSAVVQDGMLRM